jgi:PTS system galactitol-specific IIC component
MRVTFRYKHVTGRENIIGLDSTILIGQPAAVSSALLLVPTAIFLSLILPGNQVLLFALLVVVRFVMVMLAPIVKGKFARIWIAGVLELLIGFYIATNMADLYSGAPPREAEEPAAAD